MSKLASAFAPSVGVDIDVNADPKVMSEQGLSEKTQAKIYLQHMRSTIPYISTRVCLHVTKVWITSAKRFIDGAGDGQIGL